MNLATLDKLDGPHLHLLVGDPGQAWEKVTYPLQGSGKVVRAVRGKKMRTVRGVYDEFGAALQFPDYFGENWPAFDECLTDLDWLGYDVPGYVVIVTRAGELLADEEPERRVELLRLLGKAAAEWAEPVTDGEWWDRAGRPFHVVLQEAEAGAEALLTELRFADLEVGEVWRD